MNRHNSLCSIATSMLVTLLSSALYADLVIEAVPDSTSVNVGEEIVVTIQLMQDGNGSGDLRNALTTGFGLTSYGFGLATSGASFSPSPAGPTNSLPSTWIVTPTANTLSALDLDLNPPFEFNSLEASVGTVVPLGRFTFTANTPGTTVLSLVDLSPFTNFGFDNVFTSLDTEVISSASTVTLTAVPEPSSLLHFMFLGVFTVGTQWFRAREHFANEEAPARN